MAYAVSLADGSVLASWLDSSVNGRNGVAVGLPIFKKNIVGGKPVVRLRSASSDGFNLATSIPYDAPWTAFMVMKRATPTSVLVSLGGDTNQGTGTIYSDGLMYANCSYFLMTCNLAGSGVDLTQFHIYTVDVVSGALVNFYVDGTLLPNGGGGGTVDAYKHIGYVGAATPMFSDGDLAEIIMYAGSLAQLLPAPRATGDRANIEAGLSSKYGIAVTSG
jgi:hypothetical protein